jgi:hypothetical protein
VRTEADVDLVLVSVEVWTDEVVVRMRGLPNERTAALAAGFHEALDEWHGQGRSGKRPEQPAERVFDFEVSVGDDIGTAYSPTSSARGGSGTMFRAEWSFVPGPPETARSLVVRTGDVDTHVDLITRD